MTVSSGFQPLKLPATVTRSTSRSGATYTNRTSRSDPGALFRVSAAATAVAGCLSSLIVAGPGTIWRAVTKPMANTAANPAAHARRGIHPLHVRVCSFATRRACGPVNTEALIRSITSSVNAGEVSLDIPLAARARIFSKAASSASSAGSSASARLNSEASWSLRSPSRYF